MLDSLEGLVRAEAGIVVCVVECMRIWYFQRLASGRSVGMALGLGRCYLIELCTQCSESSPLAPVAFVWLGSCGRRLCYHPTSQSEASTV